MASSPVAAPLMPVKLGIRHLLAMRALIFRETAPSIITTTENSHRHLWADALRHFGYTQFCCAGRPDATATKKMGLEGDGITMHINDRSNMRLDKAVNYRFSGSKQIALCAVLTLQGKTPVTIVVGAAHLKSGITEEDEALRAMQMHELCRFLKATMGEHSAVAAFIVGDLNAAPIIVEGKGGCRLIPKTIQAAEAEEFRLVVPKSSSSIDFTTADGAQNFIDATWTSHKQRDVSKREPNAKRQKIENKTASNDWILVFTSQNSAKPKFEPVTCASPPKGGPCPVSKMASHWSDHTVIQTTFRSGEHTFSIAGLNILAKGLEDEMIGSVPDCLHAADNADAEKAVADAEPVEEHYVCAKGRTGHPENSALIKQAPFRLHDDHDSYESIINAMGDANVASIHEEMKETGKLFADVLGGREQKEVEACLFQGGFL